MGFQLVSLGQLFPSLRTLRGYQDPMTDDDPNDPMNDNQNGDDDEPRWYALYVNSADFTALRLSQLTTVTKGDFMFADNVDLCVNNIIMTL